MIGGLVGRPVACSTGPGQPDADAGEVADVADRPRTSSRRPCSTTQRSTTSGPRAMSRSTTSLASTLAARSVTARRTWVAPTSAAEHDPRRRVEGELGRWATARRRRLAGRPDELAGEEGVDALGDRGAAETGGGGELAAGPRHAVAQMLQQARRHRPRRQVKHSRLRSAPDAAFA